MTYADKIHQLREKVTEAIRLLHEEGRIDKANRDCLADCCGININTLNDCLKHSKLAMSADVQRQFAEALGFSLDDPSWIDRHASGGRERQDTAAHFRDMLRRTRAQAKPLRLDTVASKPRDRDLATFEVTDTQESSADGISVIFDSYFRPGVDGKTIYGFNRVRLVFDLDKDGCGSAHQRRGVSEPLTLGNATLESWGTTREPEWVLRVGQAFLEGPYTTHETLFRLRGGVLGETLAVRMMVQLRDRDVTASRDDRPATKRAKEAVLDRLRALLIHPDDPEPHGWIELGVQEIKIVEAPSSC